MRAILANVALFVALARVEMRLAFADAPGLAWRALVMGSWALTAIVLGAMVGLGALLFLFVLATLLYYTKKRVWEQAH
jgi:hypothetical protein